MDLPAHPPFGVSPRKLALVEDCERSLFWTLHSWGGWSHNAEEYRRRAYLMGKLESSLATLVGSATHELATRFALAARAGNELPTRNDALAYLEERIAQVVRSTSFEAFASSPKKNPMLASRWYYSEPSSSEFDGARAKVRRISANMASSDLWESVASMRKDEGWDLYLEEFFQIPLGSGEVVTRIDMALVRDLFHDLWILDHKTLTDGFATSRDRIVEQLSTYSWVLHMRFGVEFPRLWRVSAIDWVSGETLDLQVNDEMLVNVRERLAKGMEDMKRYHDPISHVPAPIHTFEPPLEHRRWLCGRCPYLELCVDAFEMRPYS
jgi:hypothetical protein